MDMEKEKIKLVKKLLRKYRRKCPQCGVKFYSLNNQFCCEDCRDEYNDMLAEECMADEAEGIRRGYAY